VALNPPPPKLQANGIHVSIEEKRCRGMLPFLQVPEGVEIVRAPRANWMRPRNLLDLSHQDFQTALKFIEPEIDSGRKVQRERRQNKRSTFLR